MPGIKLENMTERELLIQQAGSLDTLCSGMTEMKKINAAEHKTITIKVDKLTEGKVSNRLFFWATGFIILFILGLTTYTGAMKSEVVKNTTNLERIEKGFYIVK